MRYQWKSGMENLKVEQWGMDFCWGGLMFNR